MLTPEPAGSRQAQATSPPVLLLLFNRPDTTRRLIEALADGRPADLYVAADGPRDGIPGDERLCRETRQLLDELPWPCRVHRLFHDRNLGLQAAVTSALDWFFGHVEAGIVLEDDCLPAADFFPFAGAMLERFADNARIMHISGLNMAPAQQFTDASYFFAGTGHIWGWATWRRAWTLNDPCMADWPALRRRLGRGATPLRRVLGRKFASAYAGRKKTWARVWYYTMCLHDGVAIIPAVNLVSNIGFGPDATHTRGGHHPLRVAVTQELPFPLRHPPDTVTSMDYDRHLMRYHKGSWSRRISDRIHGIGDRLLRREPPL